MKEDYNLDLLVNIPSLNDVADLDGARIKVDSILERAIMNFNGKTSKNIWNALMACTLWMLHKNKLIIIQIKQSHCRLHHFPNTKSNIIT